MPKLARLLSTIGLSLLLTGGAANASDLEDAQAEREFVPVVEVIQTAGDNALECTNYDVNSDTCDMLARTLVAGDTYVATASFLINESPELIGMLVDRGTIENGLACSDATDISFELYSAEPMDEVLMSTLEGQMMEMAQMFGMVCQAYFRAGDGYEIEYFNAAGDAVIGIPPLRSIFMTREPGLRVPE